MEAGAQVGFVFTGTAARWIGYRDQASGIASVYVDGVWQGDVDGYSAFPVAQAVMYTVEGLPPGRHTLLIEVTGSQNPASTAGWVWVDAFEFPP